MQLGVYNACLGDLPLPQALDVVAGLGLTSVEVNSGGIPPQIHLPVAELRASEDPRQAYLGEFATPVLTLTALNCNGNPLLPREGLPHAQDLVDSIELAALLGVKRLVTMSGTPAGSASGINPVWNPLPRRSPFLDVRYHQWDVAVPFWRDNQARAADADVKVAIERHPGNVVFNPAAVHRLAEQIDPTHVGAELDPSHLFWRGIDPVLAVRDLDALVCNAAAKDTWINDAAKAHGVLDDRFTPVPAGSYGYLPLGGGTSRSGWPSDSAWDFGAVGRGHPVTWCTGFLRALESVARDMAVNIEHEDLELDRLDGLRFAAGTLLDAARAL